MVTKANDQWWTPDLGTGTTGVEKSSKCRKWKWKSAQPGLHCSDPWQMISDASVSTPKLVVLMLCCFCLDEIVEFVRLEASGWFLAVHSMWALLRLAWCTCRSLCCIGRQVVSDLQLGTFSGRSDANSKERSAELVPKHFFFQSRADFKSLIVWPRGGIGFECALRP